MDGLPRCGGHKDQSVRDDRPAKADRALVDRVRIDISPVVHGGDGRGVVDTQSGRKAARERRICYHAR
jgi:hypothetical protein